MTLVSIDIYENSKNVIPVQIKIPQIILDNLGAKSVKQSMESLNKTLAFVDDLSTLAFVSKDKHSWDIVQNLLFYINHADLTRQHRYKNYDFITLDVIRKVIFDKEISVKKQHHLNCENSFSPEKAVTELAERANNHRINNHPLLNHMQEFGLTKTSILHFISNYYVNNRLFHLFIVTLSLFTPLEGRTELAGNFFDELGSGDNAMAHPILFLKNFDTIGRPSKIMPLAEALHLANAKTYAAYTLGNYHYGMGGFGFIELTMPEQMKKILKGLKQSNVPHKDLEFWELHISVDLEHGRTWFAEMLQLIKTVEDAKQCLQGGLDLLDARAIMYDGIWHAVQMEIITEKEFA